ncbi:MAG: SHOCT domain-containing protein [Thermomicrobiales bacterium]|nr:SHOCT domain-containing protein [Thermomicrobiales bacterium]
MGLLSTAAKAYVATRVVSSTHRRQQQRWAAQDAAAQTDPGMAAPAAPSMIDQLTQLGQLRDAGILTEAEFEVQKQRILAG